MDEVLVYRAYGQEKCLRETSGRVQLEELGLSVRLQLN
jgi:hypothetical protein